MRENPWKDKPVIYAPLFDRLLDYKKIGKRFGSEIEEKLKVISGPTLTVEGLEDSVRREIEDVLGARSSLSVREADERERSILNYGTPPSISASLHSKRKVDRLLEVIRDSILAYEPRIEEAEVSLVNKDSGKIHIAIEVRAKLFVKHFTYPINFIFGEEVE